jgi:glycosyltransferase involved in cell wall biosynthesis
MTEKHDHSICIIAFSTIRNDARVLRQIKYLLPHYDVIVVGFGDPQEEWPTRHPIRWYPVDTPGSSSPESFLSRIWRRALNSLILILGRCRPSFYERWYWSKRHHRQALEYAIQSHCDALLANDWEALPVAVEVATRTGAKLVFDSHEYAPLEFGNRPPWRFFFRPAIVHFLRSCSCQIDASVAAWPAISERYKQEFGLEPLVLLNTPESVALREKPVDFNHVRLVHHGVAIRGRGLENMIKVLAASHPRFRLHFILINRDPGYLDELKGLVEKWAPGRIVFEDPVRPEKIVNRISEYEIGFYLLAPTNFNNRMSLPNKLFDYIAAGLAVCIGPSQSMAEIVRQYGLGWVAPSFEPKDVTETLNQITYDQLLDRRLASRETAKKFNAATEMSKLLNIYDRLFYSTHSL